MLPLRFDDIPVSSFHDRHGNDWIGPVRQHVEEALAFACALTADGGQHLAVHCLHGKSRSAAVALAILADLLGPGAEAGAVAILLADDPEQRRAFEAALMTACPRFVIWSEFWVRQEVWQARGTNSVP